MTVGFSEKDAGRISKTVVRSETSAIGPNSHRRNHKNRGGAGEAYSGYFQAENTSNESSQKVTISEGKYQFNLESGTASETELTLSQTVNDEYIFLKGDVSTGALNVSLESSETFPEDEEEIARPLLYVVSFSDNKISNITRQFSGIVRDVIFSKVVAT
jgi:hypothetical protein